MQSRWKTFIKTAKILPSAHCGSDRLLYFAFRMKLRTAKKLKTSNKLPVIMNIYGFVNRLDLNESSPREHPICK